MEIVNFKSIKPETRLAKAARFMYYLGGAVVGYALVVIIGGKVQREALDVTFIIIGVGLYIAFMGFAYSVLSEILTVLRRIKDGAPILLSKADELTKLKKLFDDGILNCDEFQIEKKHLLNK